MSSRWPCLFALTGIVACLPILIHLIMGQYVNMTLLALEYLGWYFFFAFFVFGIDLLACPACRRDETIWLKKLFKIIIYNLWIKMI